MFLIYVQWRLIRRMQSACVVMVLVLQHLQNHCAAIVLTDFAGTAACSSNCGRRQFLSLDFVTRWQNEMSRPLFSMPRILFMQLTIQICLQFHPSIAILYPRESETRSIKDLSGKWRFQIDDSASRHLSFDQKWWTVNLPNWIDMPVPASYNDITQNATIKDFVGWAW